MILFAYGTRPEYIKIKPVLNHITRHHKTLCTGQHTNPNMVPEADINFHIDQKHDNRLDYIVKNLMDRDKIWQNVKLLVVQGDTTSALAMALSAFHHQVPVAHIEAGLRTGDVTNPYPEEMNRRLISNLARIHLCPTQRNQKNLLAERLYTNTYIVGNPVLDHLVDLKPTNGDTVIVTLHRRENHEHLDRWIHALDSLAEEYTNLRFFFIVHPNPAVQKASQAIKHMSLLSPASHADFIKILADCKMVITDSGGLQEEAAYLQKFCLVARDVTERVEGLDEVAFLCTPDNLDIYFIHTKDRKWPEHYDCPYGDGESGPRIAKILNHFESHLGL